MFLLVRSVMSLTTVLVAMSVPHEHTRHSLFGRHEDRFLWAEHLAVVTRHAIYRVLDQRFLSLFVNPYHIHRTASVTDTAAIA